MNGDHRSDTDRLNDAEAAWECARLLMMARTAAERAARLETELQAFDAAELRTKDSAVLTAAELDRLITDVFALQDGVDVMAFAANRLRGRDHSLVVPGDDLRAEAARALAAGSADPSFVLHAAGMLTSAAGFPALADALTADARFVAEWSNVSVRDLLTAFQESDPMRARRVCLTALVHPEAPMSSLDFVAIQRLADALRAADV